MTSIALGITAFIVLFWNRSITKLALEKHASLFSVVPDELRQKHMGKVTIVYRSAIVFFGLVALLGAIVSYTGPLQT